MSSKKTIENLKCDILAKLGHTLESPTEFDYLALQIANETGEMVSATTLKRLFGYIPSTSNTRHSTLSILARYLGYAGWSDYTDNRKVVSDFIAQKVVTSTRLKVGDKVKTAWKPNRKVVFAYQGGEKFVVTESEKSSLLEGDEIEAMMFVLHQPLQIKNVTRDGVKIGNYVAGMDGGLQKVEVAQQ